MTKKALIVNGHPSEESLNAEACRRVKKSLEAQNFEVEYVRAFDLPRAGHIMTDGYDERCEKICQSVSHADIIVCATPVWWFGVTSGMKDFLDGALQAGKHFKYKKLLPFLPAGPVGLLSPGKKLITITTTGGPGYMYNLGLLPNMAKRMIRASFAFCGIKKRDMRSFHFGPAGRNTPKQKIEAWLTKLENIKI